VAKRGHGGGDMSEMGGALDNGSIQGLSKNVSKGRGVLGSKIGERKNENSPPAC